MLEQTITYVAYEMDALTYFVTDVIFVIFSLWAYLRLRRAGLLLMSISGMIGIFGVSTTWAMRHFSTGGHPLVEAGLSVSDIIGAILGTIGVVLLICDLVAALPPPLLVNREGR